MHLEKGKGPVEFLVIEHVEKPSENWNGRGNTSADGSAEIRASVEQARTAQQARGFYNSRMPARDIRKVCALDNAGERTLEMVVRPHRPLGPRL